jgi:hypothetical protein
MPLLLPCYFDWQPPAKRGYDSVGMIVPMQDNPCRCHVRLFDALLAMSLACAFFALVRLIGSGLFQHHNPLISFVLLGALAGAAVGALRSGIRGAVHDGIVFGGLVCIVGLISLSFAFAIDFAFPRGEHF